VERAKDEFGAAVAALAEKEARNHVVRVLEEISQERLLLRAHLFGELLYVGQPAWNCLREIMGDRRPHRRSLAPAVGRHWRSIRTGLMYVMDPVNGVHDLLYPQEKQFRSVHPHWRPAVAAAYLTWERAGRIGAFATFAKRVGVDVRTTAEIETATQEPPLVHRYTAS
jgi:hypothetical protein